MAETYQKLGSVTVGSGGASSITFSSIPQTYTDLVLVGSARMSNAATASDVLIQLNATASGNTNRYLYGESTSAGSGSDGYTPTHNYASVSVGNSATANIFSNYSIYFPNYTGSNHKSFSVDSVGEHNASSGAFTLLAADLWSNTAAITQIVLTGASGNFMQYSTARLYGILKYS